MKIAILVSGLPPKYTGGTEIATLQTAEHAVSAGHEVHVLTAGNKSRSYQHNSFTIHEIRTLVSTPYFRGLFYTPGTTKKIMLLKPDIVHIQGLYSSLPAVMGKLPRVPYIFYERGSIHTPSPLNRVLYPLITRYADHIIAQTKYQRMELQKYTNKPVEIIPNGVDTDRFGVLSQEAARKRLNLLPKGKIIIAVGRCRHEKNLHIFIEAAKMDNKNTYILAGDGPELPKLRKQANGRVIFCGHVNNTDISTYLSAADILVSTSLSEGFPVSILEAMASGLPIVATKVCGIPEIVNDWVNGILTTPNDAMSVYKAVELVLDNEQLAERMVENNKRKAGQYTWKNVVEKLYM